jgi:hypothetical protein
MISNPLEEAICRVVNDRRIFSMPQELITKPEWIKLNMALKHSNKNAALEIIERSKDSLVRRIETEKDAKKNRRLSACQELLNNFATKIEQGSPIMEQLLERMESFGPIRCNLPNMEDYGKVIEGYGRPTAEQFFLSKIKKERNQQRSRALEALLGVVRVLYDQRVDPLEIAFFVRKIDSLTQLVEGLKWM